MQNQLKIIKNHRGILLTLIADLNKEQLCEIPIGFKNNIIWNIGHILVTQQLLSYGLSNIPFTVENELINRYRKTSVAPQMVSIDEIQTIKKLFLDTMIDFERDYQDNKFASFNHYKTSMGLELNSIDESIPFIAYHEGIHFGIILSMMKKVSLDKLGMTNEKNPSTSSGCQMRRIPRQARDDK